MNSQKSDESTKNFIILFITILVIAYLSIGIPKLFTIMAPEISKQFNLSVADFSFFLYNSTKYSLISKIIFAFAFNSRKFAKHISLYWLYFITSILNGIAIYLCTLNNLHLHIIGRYAQGATAGIQLMLIEPLIMNFSPDYIKKKLLHLKYEIVAIMAPVSILLTAFTNNWKLIFLIFIFISILSSSFIVIHSNKKNTINTQYDNNLFKNFLKNLFKPNIFMDSIIMGNILGIFLIFFQYSYIHLFDNYSNFIKAILQSLPFTISFIISKLPYRHLIKKKIYGLGLLSLSFILMQYSLFIFAPSFKLNFSLPIHQYLFYKINIFILTNSLYTIYVLFTPDILCNMLKGEHQVSSKSIVTASQILRSLCSFFLTISLNQLYKVGNYYKFFQYIIIFIGINLFLLVRKSDTNAQKQEIFFSIFLTILIFGICILHYL